jgi:hypothetical protein
VRCTKEDLGSRLALAKVGETLSQKQKNTNKRSGGMA